MNYLLYVHIFSIGLSDVHIITDSIEEFSILFPQLCAYVSDEYVQGWWVVRWYQIVLR